MKKYEEIKEEVLFFYGRNNIPLAQKSLGYLSELIGGPLSFGYIDFGE